MGLVLDQMELWNSQELMRYASLSVLGTNTMAGKIILLIISLTRWKTYLIIWRKSE